MALFKPLNTTTVSNEPFLDAVVSMTSSDNTTYTSAKALKNSDVYAAVRIIASDIASNDIQLFKKGLIEDNATLEIFNNKPNEYQTGFSFKFALAANMLLNGNSFAEIKRDGDKVESFHIIPNSKMTVKESNNGSVVYEVDKKSISPANILHFKYFTEDGKVGMSPLISLRDELDLQSNGNKTLANFFKHGVTGSGILKVEKSDLDTAAKKAIREKFEEANSGGNAQRTIVMDSTMDYKPIQIDTEVLRLVNSNDWTTKQIAKVFGLSTERLGVEQEHSNSVQTNMMYLQNTLMHYFKVFTSELSNKLFTDVAESVLRFNSEKILENDPQTTLENTIKAVQGSLMSINEGRKRIGLPTIEGGDELLVSLNYTHLNNLDKYQFRKEGEDIENERR